MFYGLFKDTVNQRGWRWKWWRHISWYYTRVHL